jgi:hypothetical protein
VIVVELLDGFGGEGAGEECVLDGVEDQVGGHRPGGPPPDDPATVGVDHERYIDESHPGRHTGKVGYPQAIWRGGVEATVHQIRIPDVAAVGDGGLVLGPVPRTLQPCSRMMRSTVQRATS